MSANSGMFMACSHKSHSISSIDTATRPGSSRNHAAVERYLLEKDSYKEFLVNGPKDNTPTCQRQKPDDQGFEQSQKHVDSNGVPTQGMLRYPPKHRDLFSRRKSQDEGRVSVTRLLISIQDLGVSNGNAPSP